MPRRGLEGSMIMAQRKRYSPEQVVRKLTTADRLLAEGKDVAAVCRELGVPEQSYYRSRNQFGGLKADDAKRLKDLERESSTLKRLLADAEVEKAALKVIARGTSSVHLTPIMSHMTGRLLPTPAPRAAGPATDCAGGQSERDIAAADRAEPKRVHEASAAPKSGPRWSHIWSHRPASTGRPQADRRGRGGCLLRPGEHGLGCPKTGEHGVPCTFNP